MLNGDCIDHGMQGNADGYAGKWIGSRTHALHRVVLCEHLGISLHDIVGMVVRHKCDNPRCINPNHLELGSPADNVRDRCERGRSNNLKGERHGMAVLTDQQVAEIRSRYVPRCKVNGCRALAKEYGVTHPNIS